MTTGNTGSTPDSKIVIEFLGVFRDIAGCKQMEIDDPGNATIAKIIEILVNNFGDYIKQRMFVPSGKLDEGLGLIHNGRVLDAENALAVPVKSGDRIVITQVMSGG
jgi:hypothetical protein